jgi:hypothetical protein
MPGELQEKTSSVLVELHGQQMELAVLSAVEFRELSDESL